MGVPKKRNFQIEAFKHRVVADPKYADKTWAILEHAIHKIYNHNASGLSFEKLYSFQGRKILGLAKFFLGIGVPSRANDLYHQIDALACLEKIGK